MMSCTSLHLLAARSESEWILGLVVGAIWVVFTILNSLAKKQQEEQRKRQLQSLHTGPSHDAGVAQPAVHRPMPTQVQQRQLHQQRHQQEQRSHQQQHEQRQQQQQQRLKKQPTAQQRQRAQQSKQRRPAPVRDAPPPIPVRTAELPSAYADIAIDEITGLQTARSSVGADAGSLHRWLRPETLRQQFILTEILQPPVALRENRFT